MTPATALATSLPWVGTWSVSPQRMQDTDFAGKTLREIVRSSVAGEVVRAHFSNRYGSAPLTLQNVHIALRAEGSSVQGDTDVSMTFNGLSAITLAPGESAVSDPMPFNVPAVSDVVVSFYVPFTTKEATGHNFSNQSKYVADGNVAGLPSITASEVGDYSFLTSLDVQGPNLRGSVVAIGASGVDGYQSTPNANRRWSNDLAVRSLTLAPGLGVLNQGISGNNLLNDGDGYESAVKRFERDALSQAGVRWVIFADAPLNDFLNGVPEATPANVIAAYQGLIALTHSRDIKFICATLTPFEGYRLFTPEAESRRTAVNAFIRAPGSGCDAVVDFEMALKDPNAPTHVLPAFDSGDHLHPNDAGYTAMANAVDLALFPAPNLPAFAEPTGCGVMNVGEGLKPGQALQSCDGRFSVAIGNDGDVSVRMGANILASTGTTGSDAAVFGLEQNGNLVVRGASGEPLWRSNSPVASPARVLLQEDGNLVIYGLNGPLWSSGTHGQ